MGPESFRRVQVLLLVIASLVWSNYGVEAAPSLSDGLVQNITRLDKGDVFFVAGSDCGVTRCGEVSGGTALSERPPGGIGGCACRCRGGLPLYREDRTICVALVEECPLTQFGVGDGAMKVPLVFLPLSGQIIHPSKEIYFKGVNKTVCAVSSAQYLTRSGWSDLREELDNDVPFSLYRDEGRTYLLWRGSEEMRHRVTGRVVVVKLACRSEKRVLLPCVAFRIQGTPPDLQIEIPAVYFSRGDLSPSPAQSHIASLSTTLLLCALVGTLIYASAFVCYIRHKRQQLMAVDNRKRSDPDVLEMPNTTTNPLLSLSSFLGESRTSSCEMLTDKEDSSRSFSSRSSSITDSLDRQNQHVSADDREENDDTDSEVFATVHRSNRPTPVLVERRPELHVNVVEDTDPVCRFGMNICQVPSHGSIRKKLYFNPVFLESSMLKQPPPAAIEFLTKIREVITIAKEKMLSKRFIPYLPAIMEERLCFEIDLSLNSDLFKSKHAAFSLKRENSRRKSYCSGCPGCKNLKFQNIFKNTLSEKEFCKSCGSTELKETIVRKWLDRIPIIETVNEKGGSCEFTTKIQGIPESIKPKQVENNKHSRKIRRVSESNVEAVKKEKGLSSKPPPPPIRSSSISEKSDLNKEERGQQRNRTYTKKKDDDIIKHPISPELKKKMNAVINELSKFRRIDPIEPRAPSPLLEVTTPFVPKTVTPITPKLLNSFQNKTRNVESQIDREKETGRKWEYEIDSLERTNITRTASVALAKEISNEIIKNNKKRSSIIPMDKLEPMKKIQEMNSRLSKTFTKNDDKSKEEVKKQNDNNNLVCKSYTIQRSNLVSEVYINDFVNTMSSTSDSEYSSPNSSIIHIGETPCNTPSQLVIEVESIPEATMIFEEEYFDPDTLERKPSAGRFLHGPVVKPKNIDQIFLKSPGSLARESKFRNMILKNDENDFLGKGPNFYNDSEVNFNYSKTVDNKQSVDGNNSVFYENCVFSNFANVLNSGSRSLSEISLQKSEEIKPPLPPKKVVGKKSSWNQVNTSKIFLGSEDSCNSNRQTSSNTYRITRSEPPQINSFIEVEDRPQFHRPLILEVDNKKPNVRNYSVVDVNAEKNSYDVEFLSLDPNYDYYSTYEYYKNDGAQGMTKGESKSNEQIAKRQNKRSVKYRNKIMSKHSKTEDSGYLSSDSNEEKHKNKFILQVSDKDSAFKDTMSDTDDMESIGDARSESGAESIETNSVFFGSLRTLSSIRRAQEMEIVKNRSGETKNECLKSSDGCKELRNAISITSPRERLAALDDL